MKMFLITFLIFASLEFSQSIEPGSDKRQVEYFINNPRSLDYKISGKKDEHRFGVEVKENKQFHHTITAEDGVRLGCYGYDLDGKSHSTHYVADDKGYRLVPHQSMITVYPKDGGEPRQASFVQSFTEDEIRSSNIRYLFPEGCQAPQAEVDEEAIKAALEDMRLLREKLFAQKATKAAEGGNNSGSNADGSTGSHRNPKLINHRGSIDLSQDGLDSDGALRGGLKGGRGGLNGNNGGLNGGLGGGFNGGIGGGLRGGINGGSIGGHITGENNGDGPASLSHGLNDGTGYGLNQGTGVFGQIPGAREGLTGFGAPGSKQGISTTSSSKAGLNGASGSSFPGLKTGGLNTYLPANVDSVGNLKSVDGISSKTCCEENRTQILLSQGSSGSCGLGFSKIVIPIESEKLAKISMAELLEVTTEANNLEMLRKLLKFVEKYNL